jgi:hypothetical protein
VQKTATCVRVAGNLLRSSGSAAIALGDMLLPAGVPEKAQLVSDEILLTKELEL